MPPKKEVKEAVVYPASKRKAPPFKPQRPSKIPRNPSTDAEKQQARSKPTAPRRKKKVVPQVDEEESSDGGEVHKAKAVDLKSDSDSDEELDENPLAPRRRPTKPQAQMTSKRKDSSRESPVSIPHDLSTSTIPDAPPALSQSDDIIAISQPLLVRLLHERFTDKKTKIDKHAVQVLQKYLEVFVREAIARAQLQKKEDAEKVDARGEVDVNWLELEDLDKVAAGMLLDF